MNKNHTIIKFLGILALAGILGYFTGKFLGSFSDSFVMTNLTLQQSKWISQALFLVLLVGNALGFLYMVWGIRNAENTIKQWDGTQEEPVDQADLQLSRALVMGNILMILSMFLLSCIFSFSTMPIHLTSVCFMTVLLINMFLQRRIVEDVKKINPEKQGDFMDMKFKKDWVNSMDEGEKQIMYQAAYKAYGRINHLCIACWLLCLLADLFFYTGILPVLIVTVIWLTTILTYQLEAIRLEHGNR